MNEPVPHGYAQPWTEHTDGMDTTVIIGLLVIAAVWSVYLLPVVFGERRDASIASTEQFDRWTHSMAHVQKHTAADLAASGRDLIRKRRRNTLAALAGLTMATFGLAWYFSSVPWLLVGLFFGSLTGLYLMLLAQVRQRRLAMLEVTHVSERMTDWEEPQVRVVAH